LFPQLSLRLISTFKIRVLAILDAFKKLYFLSIAVAVASTTITITTLCSFFLVIPPFFSAHQ